MPVARLEVPGAHFPSAASCGAPLKESQELGWPSLLPRQRASHSLSGQWPPFSLEKHLSEDVLLLRPPNLLMGQSC